MSTKNIRYDKSKVVALLNARLRDIENEHAEKMKDWEKRTKAFPTHLQSVRAYIAQAKHGFAAHIAAVSALTEQGFPPSFQTQYRHPVKPEQPAPLNVMVRDGLYVNQEYHEIKAMLELIELLAEDSDIPANKQEFNNLTYYLTRGLRRG